MARPVKCPFCGYGDSSEYAIQLHIEEQHTDDSPFVVQSQAPRAIVSSNGSPKRSHESVNESMLGDPWTRCTRSSCGEYVLLSEIDEHLELHEAIARSEKPDEQPPTPPPRKRARSAKSSSSAELTTRHLRKLEKQTPKRTETTRTGASLFSGLFSGRSSNSRSTVRQIREPRNPGRLGKGELGPHAFEKRMPDHVRRHLIEDARPQYIQTIGRDGRLARRTIYPNETVALIPVIADLCALDDDNEASYLCHPSTKHVRKLYCEGNFCGYWSIQMVLSYVQHMLPQGPQELPNVIDMQRLIEEAWDRGICPYSKIETGGVKNTRKWIGTGEAVAFFTRIGVQTEALSVGGPEEKEKGDAAEEMLDYVEAYFMSDVESAKKLGTVHITQLPPIYFQRLGHSMVIVGLEREHDGSRNLLVFDSSWATTEPTKRLLDGRQAHATVQTILKPYRRSDLSLSRWSEFELLVPRGMTPVRSLTQSKSDVIRE